MKYGVIDIGTNTIRSVVYDENLKPANELVFESKILKFTNNSVFGDEGISDLSDAIKKSVLFFASEDVKNVFAFATSAMRDVSNFDEVKNRIFDDTKIEIELLSERDEALCDFEVLKRKSNAYSGAGFDLGGGSCQILTFENDKLEFFTSQKIGVKRLLNTFETLTPEKEKSVREYIKEKLLCVPEKSFSTIFAMGGTPKKIRRLIYSLYGKDVISPSLLDELLKDYYFENALLKKESQTEFYKIPYGILVLDELCRHFSSESITVTDFGSRDGYLLKKLDDFKK